MRRSPTALLLAMTTGILLHHCGGDRNEKWVRRNAVALSSVEPSAPPGDLSRLDIPSNSVVVGLGEATHGTREFSLLKHRMVRFLVAERQFNSFVIEANASESQRLNDYIQGGAGDAKELLRGLYFWTSDTREVLDLVNWMRSWNASPDNRPKVRFYGCDAQFSRVAAEEVGRYLERVDPSFAARVSATIVFLKGEPRRPKGPPSLWSAESRSRIDADVEAIRRAFSSNRVKWSRGAGDDTWARAFDHAETLRQAWMLKTADHRLRSELRDQLMAENVLRILSRDEDARVVVWAHNGHIARLPKRMGEVLARRLGDKYLAIGLTFGEGGFRAVELARAGTLGALRTFVVGAPRTDSFEALLSRLGEPIVAIPLRNVPPELRRVKLRSVGAVFRPEMSEYAYDTYQLPQELDLLLFVEHSTPALPLRHETHGRK